ncbi:MAG TPA: hypothetical protein VF212_08070 [Longimicrobiales bacterium]
MADREARGADPRSDFEEFIRSEARSHWPEAEVRYRSRARKGSHCWQVDAPGVGEFWVGATEDVLRDRGEIDAAAEGLRRRSWLDRLPDVPTHGVQVRPGGRVLQWNPERDDTIGELEE